MDNIYIIYAGFGESTGNASDADCIWPHSHDVQSGYNYQKYYYPDLAASEKRDNYYDGLLLNHYACSNELIYTNYPDGLGTFCHEFSHVMGLPDLYYTGDSEIPINTPSTWSILDIGCYLNNSRTPPLYSSFERMSLGWMKPKVIDSPAHLTLEPLSDSNSAYLVQTEVDNEFFLFENRQNEGWDSYLAGNGMLVWHIDYDENLWFRNEVNNNRVHQNVDLVEAVSRTGINASANDPFPGGANVTEYTANSMLPTPASSHGDMLTPVTP